MVDPISYFRLTSAEGQRDYCANLQFCCDHYRSVAEVCRRLKLNRQQFNRYLMGTGLPSRHNHKRISDFFGIEVGELFLPRADFAASFKAQLESRAASSSIDKYLGLVDALSRQNTAALSEYQGFYYKYFYTFLDTKRIKRELVHWRAEKGAFVTSIKQRYSGEDETDEPSARYITYRGIVGSLGDRIFTIDTHRGSGREMSITMLYPKNRMLTRLNGMVMGIGHGSGRAIGAARVTMQFLGAEIDIRAALSKLGTFDADDASIPAAVRKAVGNDIQADESLFFARS